MILTPWYFAGFGLSLNASLGRMIMTFGAMMIVDACRDSNNRVSRILSIKPFKLAGKFSYSLYLIHAPVITTVWFGLGATSTHFGWLLRVCVSLIFILFGTFVVYKTAEEPALKWIHSAKTK